MEPYIGLLGAVLGAGAAGLASYAIERKRSKTELAIQRLEIRRRTYGELLAALERFIRDYASAISGNRPINRTKIEELDSLISRSGLLSGMRASRALSRIMGLTTRAERRELIKPEEWKEARVELYDALREECGLASLSDEELAW